MKKQFFPLNQVALLAATLMASAAHAQSIEFSGDSTPNGQMGGNYATSSITVGNTTVGSLVVQQNATLSSTGEAVLGMAQGSTGTASVSAGSRWTANNLTVGQDGTARMNIFNGGQLVSAGAYVGKTITSNGRVSVGGAQSSWTIPAGPNANLWVGYNGAASMLQLLEGGTVTTQGDLYAAFSPAGTPVNPYNSTQINIEGVGSVLTANGACHLGSPNPFNLSILDGGSMHCGSSSYIARGGASLARENSKWTINGHLDIGREPTQVPVSLGIAEQSSVVVQGDLRLPFVSSAGAGTQGILTISGRDNPGVLDTQNVVFGANGMGIINFSHIDTSGNYIFEPSISGPGLIYVVTAGTTTLSGNNTYSGFTNVTAGTLRAGSENGFSNASDFNLHPTATLDTASFSPVIRDLGNSGVVNMLGGGTNSTLTVARNYSGTGTGGIINMNTVLGDSNSPTQRLVVNGNTSGTTTLNITNVGGTGAPTAGNGILVVEVAGASNGVFTLPAPGYLEVGSFRYDLVKTGNNWYLVNEARAENVPEASVVCAPAELTAPNQVATCTVSLSTATTADLSVNLNTPAPNARFTTTCTSPIVVPANASQASCTITAVGSGAEATAELSIAAPSVPDAYTVGGAPSRVLVKESSGGGDNGGGDNGGGDNGGGDNGGGDNGGGDNGGGDNGGGDNGGGDNGGGDNGGGDNGGGDNGGGDNGGGDNGGGVGVAHKVPTLGAVGLMTLASIMGLVGLRRTRSPRKSA